jgi:hypothetical protein
MQNRQVPQSEWFTFFKGFSRRHEDWLVTVRVVSSRLGSQVEARDLPLEGIVATPDGQGPISIHVGRAVDKHMEHEVVEPLQVWVELTDDGGEAALEIESRDGTKTILQFRSAPPPEAVDGILQP